MPWSTSDRRARLPSNWPELRAATKRRAHGRCEQIKANGERCNAFGNQCDHVKRDGPDTLDNLQWLCPHHHDTKSAREGHDAARRAREKAMHPREQHPAKRDPRPGPLPHP